MFEVLDGKAEHSFVIYNRIPTVVRVVTLVADRLHSMRQLQCRSIATSLDGMPIPGDPPAFLSGCPDNSPVPIYTPEWREAMWEYLAQEHNTMTPASHHANHQATAPPKNLVLAVKGLRFTWSSTGCIQLTLYFCTVFEGQVVAFL